MPYEEDIQQLVISVWDSMLRLPVDMAEEPLPSEEHTLVAWVQISGSWRGALALSCGIDMAAEAAAIMFGIERANITTADMQDALGELANMIGGNFKALLPQPCGLSLPAVVEGTDYSVRIPESKLMTRLALRCGRHPMSVSVMAGEAKAA